MLSIDQCTYRKGFSRQCSLITKIEKASQKFNALAQGSNSRKTKNSYECMFLPTIWMLHGLILNNTINKLQERALPLVYKGSASFSSDLNNLPLKHPETCY